MVAFYLFLCLFLLVRFGRVRSASAAILSLEAALLTENMPVAPSAEAAKEACARDLLVTAVIEALPKSTLASGTLSLPELQARFKVLAHTPVMYTLVRLMCAREQL